MLDSNLFTPHRAPLQFTPASFDRITRCSVPDAENRMTISPGIARVAAIRSKMQSGHHPVPKSLATPVFGSGLLPL